MILTPEEHSLLDGEHGPAARKAMQILAALGEIYGAERLLPVSSVQIAGVSYDNLGDAGLAWLDEMASGGGRARVLTTLNPAGMDTENWRTLGISPDFAEKQDRVLQAFERMNVVPTCTCTPYLSGNLPHYGEHLAWAESSAVCFANSIIGARSNREGGPSALAAALTGRTPAYGYHLDENRRPHITVAVEDWPPDDPGTACFGALGKVIGEKLQAAGLKVPYITGIPLASQESLKSFCASIATYGGVALFHMLGITPETPLHTPPETRLIVTPSEIARARQSLSDAAPTEADFVSLGCPHLSIREIAHLAKLLEGKQVQREFWITTARPTRQIADRMGLTQVIEASGAKFAADTCCVVAPIRGRFHVLATDSAKACYYAYAKNQFKTAFLPFDEVVTLALTPIQSRETFQ
jgi:predicted aconitase